MTESFLFWSNFLNSKSPVFVLETEERITSFYNYSQHLVISHSMYFNEILTDEISFHKKEADHHFDNLVIHRMEGPALFSKEGLTVYFIDNTHIQSDEFWKRPDVIKAVEILNLKSKITNL